MTIPSPANVLRGSSRVPVPLTKRERNLSFNSADVSGAGTRDKPLRTSEWEASMTTNHYES